MLAITPRQNKSSSNFLRIKFCSKKNNQRMLLSKNYIFDTCKKLFIRSITNVQKIFIQGLYLTSP